MMKKKKQDLKSKWQMSLIGSLTLGLAPFFPEPHLIGKIRWIMGGAKDMALIDYLDLLMHGFPFAFFLFFSIKMLEVKISQNENISDTPE